MANKTSCAQRFVTSPKWEGLLASVAYKLRTVCVMILKGKTVSLKNALITYFRDSFKGIDAFEALL